MGNVLYKTLSTPSVVRALGYLLNTLNSRSARSVSALEYHQPRSLKAPKTVKLVADAPKAVFL